jgi:nucleotide-binding universal stress UspA family protein
MTMFKHLLIPLDGSHLAESVLPAAAYMARTLGAAVTLLHIIEHDAPKEVHHDRHLTTSDEACVYLGEVAERFFPLDARIDEHVHTAEVNDVARSIADHAREFQPDLILMCTHGSSGPRDWLFGSIAQQVIAMGETPVMLLPPHSRGFGEFNCRLLLVPLDGDPSHEAGLKVAAELANAWGAALHLLMVIPTVGTLAGERAAVGQMLPTTMKVLLDMEEQNGREYLEVMAGKVKDSGASMRLEVARGDPVMTIVNVMERLSADLVVMGTHGKAGADAFWSRSTTPKLSGRSEIPLLLVPVHPHT